MWEFAVGLTYAKKRVAISQYTNPLLLEEQLPCSHCACSSSFAAQISELDENLQQSMTTNEPSISSNDNLIGFLLAMLSSAFIGSSFIIKKLGLRRAGASGSRASSGGYGYLLEPLWWIGMITMIVGEFSNFVAYVYAPAILVTPLGAISIIVSAVLAHFFLKEKLQKMGVLGCVLCVVGSTMIVLHAPGERSPSSVDEIWELATQPTFLLYTASVIAIVLFLVLYCEPRYGQTNILIYIGICSIIGSLTVMSIKAIGIAIKLTLEGWSQVAHFQTWVFVMVAISCIIVQLNYLNKFLPICLAQPIMARPILQEIM